MAEGAADSNWSLVCEEKQEQMPRRKGKEQEKAEKHLKCVGEEVYFHPCLDDSFERVFISIFNEHKDEHHHLSQSPAGLIAACKQKVNIKQSLEARG